MKASDSIFMSIVEAMMRRSSLSSLLLITALLAACQPTNGPSGANENPFTGNGSANPTAPGGNTAPAVSYGAFKPVEAPALTVKELKLTTVPKAGVTMADLDRDEDPSDDFEPTLDVIAQQDAFGAGLTAPNATIKVRGHSTRESSQKSFTVELTKESPDLGGYKTLYLNKHPWDLTRVRNKLTFDMFKAVPELLTLNTQFVHLTIDGKDYGLFTQVEKPGDRMLEARGLDPDGNLYKAEQFEFAQDAALKDVATAGYSKKEFEKILEIREGKDHKKLLAMLADVNNDDMPINDVVAKHFDRKNYVTWLAMNMVLDNRDTNSQNFLLYSPQNAATWTFVPWDYDAAWGFYDQPNEATGHKLMRWQNGLANWWGVRLHRRFFQNPENVRQVLARADQLVNELLTRDRVMALMETYRPVVKPLISVEVDREELTTSDSDKVAAWENEFNRLASVPAQRLAAVKETLERPMPIYLDDPNHDDGPWTFKWDASYDLQGDGLTYDFKLAKDTGLTNVVAERKGLTATRVSLTETLAPGTYYWTVTVRDTKNPAVNWQVPFDNIHTAGGQQIEGLKELTVE
jgi:spore coat protein H